MNLTELIPTTREDRSNCRKPLTPSLPIGWGEGGSAIAESGEGLANVLPIFKRVWYQNPPRDLQSPWAELFSSRNTSNNSKRTQKNVADR
jgi:hypothetical protein